MDQMAMFNSPRTKRQRLLELLTEGRRLSKQDILREVGIWNSGDQVMKLRRAGNDIKTEMITEGSNTYAIYFIPKRTSAPTEAEAVSAT